MRKIKNIPIYQDQQEANLNNLYELTDSEIAATDQESENNQTRPTVLAENNFQARLLQHQKNQHMMNYMIKRLSMNLTAERHKEDLKSRQ